MTDNDGPLLALFGTIDRALTDQGVNPEIVTQEDKILIAIQYVETATVREKMSVMTLPEDHPIEHVLDAPS